RLRQAQIEGRNERKSTNNHAILCKLGEAEGVDQNGGGDEGSDQEIKVTSQVPGGRAGKRVVHEIILYLVRTGGVKYSFDAAHSQLGLGSRNDPKFVNWPIAEEGAAYDLGAAWKQWTGLPFVFAVWVAQRATDVQEALRVHGGLIASRDWGLAHLDILATQASLATGVGQPVCLEYLSGLDYRLSYGHLAGLTEFFRRLVAAGRVPDGSLAFLPAA
ncbi:MAG: hypothetical protein B7Z72_03195, partial [Gemmatimonadetes bacterium 21-71-4]